MLYSIRIAYFDVLRGGLWDRKDGTPEQLKIVMPKVRDYLIDQGELKVVPTSTE